MTEIGIAGAGAVADEFAARLSAAGRVNKVWRPGDDLAGCELVLELSVDTSREAKRAALVAVSDALSPSGVVATALESTSIAGLAGATGLRGRLVGMHCVRRGGGDGIVELVVDERAPREPLIQLAALLSDLQLETIDVKDRPGLLLDALHLPFINQAIQAMDDGLATAEDIELAVELGLGHAVGPLRAVDNWGVEPYLAHASALYEQTGNRWLMPPPLVRSLVESSRGGDTALLDGERGPA